MSRNLSNLKICVEKTAPFFKNISRVKDKKLKYSIGALRAAFLKNKIWPPDKMILNIYFINPENSQNIFRTRYSSNYLKDNNGKIVDIDPLQRVIDSRNMNVIDAIKLIINERYNKFSGITFNFVDNMNDSDIRISFDSADGAWSYVGKDSIQYKNQPTMNLGWFDVATVMHEFGHALGLIHEHQNPSGKDIQWNTKVVYEWASQTQGWDNQTTYTNIVEKYSIDQLNATSFDPESIMLYFFPAQLTMDNKGTSENLQLSASDVIHMSNLYPSGKMTPKEFFQYAYNKNIDDPIKYSEQTEGLSPLNMNLYIIIPIAVLVIILILFYMSYF